MAWYRLVGPDGAAAFHELRAGQTLPPGAEAVDRAPGRFEDCPTGEWVTDHRGLADSRVPDAEIAEARALKYIEALLTLSPGAPLATGLLALEAKEKGLTVKALAEQVLAKRRAFIVAEVRRQRGQAGNHGDYAIPAGDPLAKL